MTRPHARDFAKAQVGGTLRDSWAEFEEDLVDPAKNPVPFDKARADLYTERLDAYGKLLLNSWQWSAAQALYEDAAARSKQYEEAEKQIAPEVRRHRGLLLANAGVACIAQGNFDLAIARLFEAASEDVRNCEVKQIELSYAYWGLFDKHYGAELRAKILGYAQTADSSITEKEVTDFLADTTFGGLPIYAYLYRIETQAEVLGTFDNVFSRSEVLQGLRGIAAVIESSMKRATGWPTGYKKKDKMLANTYLRLYGILDGDQTNKKTWFHPHFELERLKIEQIKDNAGKVVDQEPIDERVKKVKGLASALAEVEFLKSLMVTYWVRNEAAHNDDANIEITTTQRAYVLSRMFHVALAFRKMM